MFPSSPSPGYVWARAGEHRAPYLGAGGPSGQAGSCPCGCGRPELGLKKPVARVPEKRAGG